MTGKIVNLDHLIATYDDLLGERICLTRELTEFKELQLARSNIQNIIRMQEGVVHENYYCPDLWQFTIVAYRVKR